MTKLTNYASKKILAGFMAFAVLLAVGGVMSLNAPAASAQTVVSGPAFVYTGTLRVGMSGARVVALQSALNYVNSGVPNLVLDGKFGPMTLSAVKKFQISKGLVVDGIVGPNTGSALAAATLVVVVPSPTLPAGCTSTAGFSPITGVRCDSMVTGLPVGCTSTIGYSPITGVKCDSTIPGLPAGCSSTAGYSPTTGVKCDSNVTTPPSTGGALQGGAGDITVTELSSPSSNTRVAEGDSNAKILGFEVEADAGSDVRLTSMRVTFEKTAGSGNDRFDRYAEEVSIWMGSTKVGSADVDEFSESSGVYTKSINLSNAIVRADQTANFYVAVDAIDDIDSANVGSSSNTWTATLTSTRFEDAAGAILIDSTGSVSNTFIFDTLANAGDVELKVSLASGSPSAGTQKVSTTTNTNQVELLKFTLQAQNSAMTVDQIPVVFTTSETDLDEVTSNVTLVIDGKTFNESVSTSNAASATISFDDLDIDLDANETLTGTIYADINDLESGTFDEGTTLTASITSSLVTTTGSSAGALDVEDRNGNQLASGDRSGSAIGETITFRSEGVNVVMGATSYSQTTNNNGEVTSVTYSMPVAVTAFGDTLYLGQSAQLATSATGSNAFSLVLETAAAPNTESTSGTVSITLSSSNASIEGNGYRLDDGQTKNFIINATLLAGTDNTSHRFRIDQVRTFEEAALNTGTNSNLLPVENYRTDFRFINN